MNGLYRTDDVINAVTYCLDNDLCGNRHEDLQCLMDTINPHMVFISIPLAVTVYERLVSNAAILYALDTYKAAMNTPTQRPSRGTYN